MTDKTLLVDDGDLSDVYGFLVDAQDAHDAGDTQTAATMTQEAKEKLLEIHRGATEL